MTEWFLKLIGVQDEIRAHLEQASLEFQHPLLLWLGLILILPAGWFIYQRQRHNLASVPNSLRQSLTATRVIILLLLVFVLAGPYLKLDEKIEKKPIVALLFDHSQSMGLPAGPFETDEEMLPIAEAAGYQLTDGKLDAQTRQVLNKVGRAKLAQEVVQFGADSWIKPLWEKYDVRLYSLAGAATRMPVSADKFQVPEPQATGPETHLGDGLEQIMDEAAGRQLAGVVLFSDGQNTGGRAPVEMARAAADLSAPIFVVPAGSEAPLRDISVVDIFAPDLVSVGDTVNVSVTLEVQGYPEQAVKVSLLEDGSPTPLNSKDLVLRNTEQQHLDLSFEAKQPGARTLTVKIEPATELPEDLPDNNSDSVVVRVSEDKLRVLYVEGFPRWDFRFLKNSMRRDHGLGGRGLGAKQPVAATPAAAPPAAPAAAPAAPAATTIAGPVAGGETTDQPDLVLETELRRLPAAEQQVLPQTLDDLAEYHTIILGDVSPAVITPAFVTLLAQAVRERGVGLLVEAGPQSMPHAYDERFMELLPVKFRPKALGMEAPAYKPFRLEVSPDGSLHESMRLYDDAGRNDNVWSHMPPYFWCAAAERPSPAATVLAYNPSVEGRFGKLPLVAHHYAGLGKVMFVGTDSTWLWRQNVGDRFFYRFWGQAIRFVARRETDDVRKKSWVEIRPVRARPGEVAQIEMKAFAADGSPRSEPTLTLKVLREGAAPGTVEMSQDKSSTGRYVGKLTPEATGSYQIVYEPGGGLEPVEARMHVSAATEELRRPNVNVPALAQLGTLVKLSELATIPAQFKGEPKLAELHREQTVWDNWLTLSLLVFVYSLDVGLRRLAGLS